MDLIILNNLLVQYCTMPFLGLLLIDSFASIKTAPVTIPPHYVIAIEQDSGGYCPNGEILCGYKCCEPEVQWCDNIWGECGSCVEKCSTYSLDPRHEALCLTECPVLYKKTLEAMRTSTTVEPSQEPTAGTSALSTWSSPTHDPPPDYTGLIITLTLITIVILAGFICVCRESSHSYGKRRDSARPDRVTSTSSISISAVKNPMNTPVKTSLRRELMDKSYVFLKI